MPAMDEQPDVRTSSFVKVPSIDGLAEVDSAVANPQDVAREVLSCPRRKGCQAPVVLIVISVNEIMDEGAEVRFRLSHGRWRRAQGGGRDAGVLIHVLPQLEGQGLDGSW